jgi:hypothetical protein
LFDADQGEAQMELQNMLSQPTPFMQKHLWPTFIDNGCGDTMILPGTVSESGVVLDASDHKVRMHWERLKAHIVTRILVQPQRNAPSEQSCGEHTATVRETFR